MISAFKDQFSATELAFGAMVFSEKWVGKPRWNHSTASVTIGEDDRKRIEVRFDFSGIPEEQVHVRCNCSSAGKRLCMHVWAAILSLSEDALAERLVAGHPHLRLVPSDMIPLALQPLGTKGELEATKQQTDWLQNWNLFQRQARTSMSHSLAVTRGASMSSGVNYYFVISIDEQRESVTPRIYIFRGVRLKDGRVAKATACYVGDDTVTTLSDPLDRKTFLLLGARSGAVDDSAMAMIYHRDRMRGSKAFEVSSELLPETLSHLAQTGRWGWVLSNENQLDIANLHSLEWDGGGPWRLLLSVQEAKADRDVEEEAEEATGEAPSATRLVPHSSATAMYTVQSALCRGAERRALTDAIAIYEAGVVLWNDQASLVRESDVPLIRVLMNSPLSITFPGSDLERFMSRFSELPAAPELELAASLDAKRELGTPRPKLVIAVPRRAPATLHGDLRFIYGDEHETEVSLDDGRSWLWQSDERKLLQRNVEKEHEHFRELLAHPIDAIRYPDPECPGQWRISAKDLPTLTLDLIARGWQVVAEGRRVRTPADFAIEIKSGIDWFDVHGSIDFDGTKVALPAILDAIRNRNSFVQLGDGSQGILPEDWLRRYAGLAELIPAAHDEGDGQAVRVPRSQALLLEILLAEHQQVVGDRNYRQLCDRLRNFQGIHSQQEPESFRGELRPYQREGLGWMEFLRDFQFGGCLADDMGLGKTVQVLAMLESRRVRRLKKNEVRRPSLAVVPKSLIFNWLDEAARFVPKLRVANYTGVGRKAIILDAFNLIVTTYGTLRQDIGQFMDYEFDYLILDESQAIKNPRSQAAQCCRLLKGKHRLAMSGTPVENHLGELWSLFEFLNPGMIAHPGILKRFQDPDPDSPWSLATLARSLRPFMLRRTKEQVLTELPAKTEQTLFCEMSNKQRQVYDELRKHYQLHLSNKIKELGIKRSKIHVLEALLRLRQAACDPRLLDEKHKSMGVKLETLLEQVGSVIEEGHKALIFSQFTSLLALVRKELDAKKIRYEYLDGKTSDRAGCVQRFQTDSQCPLFLISLKAGGHGLNLTAADYVFILDPWWNPAVEAQAVDRAHRIGQTRHVIAYRLICKDSIEEKILRLQESKRDLADAIVADNDSLISQLSVDDLSMLLGD